MSQHEFVLFIFFLLFFSLFIVLFLCSCRCCFQIVCFKIAMKLNRISRKEETTENGYSARFPFHSDESEYVGTTAVTKQKAAKQQTNPNRNPRVRDFCEIERIMDGAQSRRKRIKREQKQSSTRWINAKQIARRSHSICKFKFVVAHAIAHMQCAESSL